MIETRTSLSSMNRYYYVFQQYLPNHLAFLSPQKFNLNYEQINSKCYATFYAYHTSVVQQKRP